MSILSTSLMITINMIMFYLMHRKSNALDKFKEFKVELENQLGKQLKVLQYDLCVEYMSSEFDFFS